MKKPPTSIRSKLQNLNDDTSALHQHAAYPETKTPGPSLVTIENDNVFKDPSPKNPSILLLESTFSPSHDDEPPDTEALVSIATASQKPNSLLARSTSPARCYVKDTDDEVQLTAMSFQPDHQQPSSSEILQLRQAENFEQPAASSLVSPPASSHDGIEKSPPPMSQVDITPSSSSSRHSSRHPKQVQRYTPESGPARRASSSSVGDATAEKNTPLIADPFAADASRKESRYGAALDILSDEKSLKLIKELQAQEHGLRKRRRA